MNNGSEPIGKIYCRIIFLTNIITIISVIIIIIIQTGQENLGLYTHFNSLTLVKIQNDNYTCLPVYTQTAVNQSINQSINQ